MTHQRGRAVNSVSQEIAIPSDVLRNWQRIVDLLANIMRVPSAVVTKLEPPHNTCYKTIVSSNSEGNPFPTDQSFAMDIGTFCETVIKTREPLLVATPWKTISGNRAPEIQVGMVSYLGFPVLWPDGRMFGTICVLDDKANRYSDRYQELLVALSRCPAGGPADAGPPGRRTRGAEGTVSANCSRGSPRLSS